MTPDPYQSSILAFLFDKLSVGEEVDTLEFSLAGAFKGKFCAAHSNIGDGSHGKVVFTLPRYSNSVFVALTYDHPSEIARLLANLEDYERETSRQLRLGEVVITPSAGTPAISGGVDPYAVILLRTAVAEDCAQVPDAAILGGKHTSFFLVVPLTMEEWTRRKQGGHDALIDLFQRTGKSIYFL